MNWHSATVHPRDLLWLVETIRSLEGTVIGSRPDDDGVRVIWTTSSASGRAAGWRTPPMSAERR